MSLLKNWKLLLAALAVAMFTACAGSNGGSSSDNASSAGAASESAAASAPKPKKPEASEAQVKKAEKDAMASTEENHKLRKEIFEAKTKLGMSADEEVPVE